MELAEVSEGKRVSRFGSCTLQSMFVFLVSPSLLTDAPLSACGTERHPTNL